MRRSLTKLTPTPRRERSILPRAPVCVGDDLVLVNDDVALTHGRRDGPPNRGVSSRARASPIPDNRVVSPGGAPSQTASSQTAMSMSLRAWAFPVAWEPKRTARTTPWRRQAAVKRNASPINDCNAAAGSPRAPIPCPPPGFDYTRPAYPASIRPDQDNILAHRRITLSERPPYPGAHVA